MSKVLIIGAGGVSRVATKKCAQNSDIFQEIILASRTISKCNQIAKEINQELNIKIQTRQIDADNVDKLIALINELKVDLVMNLALPYQDLYIMDACIATKTNYLDTANYEHPDKEGFEYKEQWARNDAFKKAGIIGVLGSGFDPGATNVFCAYANQYLFDTIKTIDILDCNDGDHGYPFATNFNPEINLREVSANGRYWENNKWITTKPMQIKMKWDYPQIGQRDSYLLYHEELESLSKNIQGLERIRFFMTFSKSYLNHMECLQNVGMLRIDEVDYEGNKIIPIRFLKQLLPDPSTLGSRTHGKTNIGCVIEGIKDKKIKKIYIYNICDHQKCFIETKANGVSYTTGVPAMIGAKMILEKKWDKKGVFNIEDFDTKDFLEEMPKQGLNYFIDEIK